VAADPFTDKVHGVLSDPLTLPQPFLDYLIQYAAVNPTSTAPKSGARIAYGTRTTNAVTAGTTFGTGVDLLATPLTFTAAGSNSYIVRAYGTAWLNNGTAGTTANNLSINLDGADGGQFVSAVFPSAGFGTGVSGSGLIVKPAAGSHTVNVRMTVSAGTGTIVAGAGGAGANVPILVTLEIA
jgi:hypothetical protein